MKNEKRELKIKNRFNQISKIFQGTIREKKDKDFQDFQDLAEREK